MGNRLLKCMLVSYGISALIGILSILGGAGSLALNMLATSLVASMALTLSLLALLLLKSGNQKLRWLMILTTCLIVIGAFGCLAMIWGGPNFGLGDEMLVATITLAFSGLHFGYVFFWKRLNTLFRTIIWILAVINAFLVALIMLGLFYSEFFETFFQYVDEDFFGRSVGAMVLVLLIGTLSLPIMNFTLRKRHHESDKGVLDRRVEVPIHCPRCSFACALKVGHVTCPQCKLAMRFEVEEPRCSCGYLLYRFEGTSCPECSRSIPGHLRWESLSPSSGS